MLSPYLLAQIRKAVPRRHFSFVLIRELFCGSFSPLSHYLLTQIKEAILKRNGSFFLVRNLKGRGGGGLKSNQISMSWGTFFLSIVWNYIFKKKLSQRKQYLVKHRGKPLNVCF